VLSDRVVADPPVVLAPMAGITNTAFRRLCREAMRASLAPGREGGLFVSEMITSRALVERNAKTMRLVRFDADEQPRSIQLYGLDPVVVGAAVRLVVADDLADHIDLNFGCPVPKVTRKGGGAALPWRIGLFEDIVTAAVRAIARPEMTTPVVTVMLASAMILPAILVVVPRVAELPTCQKTSHG